MHGLPGYIDRVLIDAVLEIHRLVHGRLTQLRRAPKDLPQLLQGPLEAAAARLPGRGGGQFRLHLHAVHLRVGHGEPG